MDYFAENLKKYRLLKGLTQEDIANFLGITPQSVSKWERSETYPDITFLPALANILSTSIDCLIGMDEMRSEQMRNNIHSQAYDLSKYGELIEAERTYRKALGTFPTDPGMLLGLASVLALKGEAEEAAELIERGLPLSQDEKQNATMRAVLCFVYARMGESQKAKIAASKLPHRRESREVIAPIIASQPSIETIDRCIKAIVIGEELD